MDQSYGIHYIVDFDTDKTELLENAGIMRFLLVSLLHDHGYTILKTEHHQFSPYGASVTCILCESHASIHTWPENGFCSFDLYTCDKNKDPYATGRKLMRMLDAIRIRAEYIIERGIDRFGFIDDMINNSIALGSNIAPIIEGMRHAGLNIEPIKIT